MQIEKFTGSLLTTATFFENFFKNEDGLMDGRMDRYVMNKYNKMLIVKYKWVDVWMFITKFFWLCQLRVLKVLVLFGKIFPDFLEGWSKI